jgi:hypothetical protein
MAADDETQDAVRRILKKRPPEDLPSGSEARLRKRLDEEPPPTRATSPARKTVRKNKTVRTKKQKAVR